MKLSTLKNTPGYIFQRTHIFFFFLSSSVQILSLLKPDQYLQNRFFDLFKQNPTICFEIQPFRSLFVSLSHHNPNPLPLLGLRKPVFTKVEQLRPGTNGHTLTVKIVSTKMVLQKGRSDGPQLRQMRIAECMVGDETGMIIFTTRNDQGKFIIDIEFLDLKTASPGGGELCSIWAEESKEKRANATVLSSLGRMLTESIHTDITINADRDLIAEVFHEVLKAWKGF